jgi:hypothetical protein
MQESCSVCTERTIGLEIVLDATNGTPHDVDQVRSHFGPLGCKVGAWSVPNVTLAQKSFWMHPVILLGYEAQLEAHFGLFGDSANLDAR